MTVVCGDDGENHLSPIASFLADFAAWAAAQPGLLAVALVGSHARGAATAQSDVDLVILAIDWQPYLDDTAWVGRFGSVARQQIEHYGRVTSLRVWYADGPEVEFGLTASDWASLPADEGTRRVVQDGMRVLWERLPILTTLVEGTGR